jgi:Kef-type K+ transport system membrane component KefB
MSDYPFLPPWPLQFGQLFWVATLLIGAVVAGEAAHRWLRVPRIVGYLVAGVALGPHGGRLLAGSTLQEFQLLLDVAVGLLLFELGQRVDIGWLRRNPGLFATSLCEAGLAFAAVYMLMILLGESALASAAAAALAMATSPAVVMVVVKDLRAQGQVTERILLLTALNTVYAVVAISLIGVLTPSGTSSWAGVVGYPLYVVLGATVLAAAFAWFTLALLRLLGRGLAFQFSVVLAVVLAAVAAAQALKLSVPLTLLLVGLFARTLDRERHFVALRLGETATVFIVILFAVAGAMLEYTLTAGAIAGALGFIAARMAAKIIAVLVLARPSALAARKAFLVGVGLAPMSSLALLMLQDLARLYPEPGGNVAASLMLAITMLAFAGPLATQFAIREAREAAEGGRE